MLLAPFLFCHRMYFPHFRLYLTLSKRCLVVILRVKFSMYRHLRNRHIIPSLFARIVTKYSNKPALVYEATGEVGLNWVFQINQPCYRPISWCFRIHYVPGLEFLEAAGALPCCCSLGAGTGMDWGRCGCLVHGKPAYACGSLVGSGYDWCRGSTHQLQPSAANVPALRRCVWCSGNGVRVRDERR